MFGQQGASNYAAAKAGLYGLTRALALEGLECGIRVNAVLPGGVSRMSDDVPPGPRQFHQPELREVLRPRRLSEAVSPLVAYLLSAECSVNGEAYVAQSGIYARVFVGVASGWIASNPATVSVDDIASHFDDIRDLRGFVIPTDNHHHNEQMGTRLGWTPPDALGHELGGGLT